MTEQDSIRFATILTGIAEYYGKALSDGVVELYWQGLRQYDLAAVEKALWEHTQNPDHGQFMPKIADVVRGLTGRTQDQAAVAWAKVDRAVRVVGVYRDVVFDDALIHRVLADMGGWIGLGNKTEDDWPFVAREFENRYRGYRLRGETPDYPPRMIGLANAYNAQEHFRLEAPVLVGNQQAAQSVLDGGTTAPMIGIRQAGETVASMTIKRIAAA